MKTIFYLKTTGDILFILDDEQLFGSISSSTNYTEDEVGIFLVDEVPFHLRKSYEYKVVDDGFVKKTEDELPIEIEEPIVTNEELKNEIEELKEIIDIMLGGME